MGERPASERAGEFELIARYFAPLARDFPGAFGLGDDTARFAAPQGRDLVVTTDMLVAGVHFLPDDPPGDIARKSLRVNLSDLAAAGARPLAYQLSVAWPRNLPESWIAAFAEGLADDQRLYGIVLSGGDTVSTSGPLTINVTAFGSVPTGQGLGRAGARAGDVVMVSGTIGDAWLGLQILTGREPHMAGPQAAHAIARYRLPQPRSLLGPRLTGLARACIDVSDGLVADLGHLCERSSCGAILEADRVPLSPAARSAVERAPDCLARLIAGGDDYELLFAVPAESAAGIARELSTSDVPVTEIGRFVANSGVNVRRRDGALVDVPVRGWQHL